MPNATIEVGPGTTLSISGDLSNRASGAPAFSISGLGGLLTKPIGEITLPAVSGGVGLQRNTSFDVGSGSDRVTFGFNAGLGGELALLKPADTLFTVPAFDEGTGTDVTVPDGRMYLKIGFKASIGASGAFKGSAGSLGIDVSASVGRTFDVINFIPISPAQTLQQALTAAFGAFRFPFDAGAVEALGDGHHIFYNYVGTLGFAAGMSWGLSIAGRSLKEVTASAGVPWVEFGLRPTIKAAARLGVSLNVTDHFQVIVGRHRSAGDQVNAVTLSVSKLDERVLGAAFSVNITAKPNASVSLNNEVDALINQAAEPLLVKLPEMVRARALAAFKRGIGADELQKFVDEAQEHIDTFVAKVNTAQGASFTATYKRTRTRKSLFGYRFDFNEPAARGAGYADAMRGDFLAALASPGVDLAPGSFLEDSLVTTTALTLKVFNLLEASDQLTFTSRMRTVYAGGGVFHVVYQTGGEWKRVLNASSESVQMYFEADAATIDLKTFSDLDVTLTYKFIDKGNPDAAGITLQTLAKSGNQGLAVMAGRLTAAAQAKDFTLTVTGVILHPAYSQLTFDPVRIDGKLNPRHPNDAGNFVEFVHAVNSLNRGFEQFAMGRPELQTYEAWRIFDVAASGEPSDGPADRKESANLNIWPGVWSQIDRNAREKIKVDLEAGRQFMNLCECLAELSRQPLTLNEQQFKDLRDVLDQAAHSVYNFWFAKAMLLAFLRLMDGPIGDLKGPADGDLVGKSVKVSFSVGAANRS